MVDQPALSKLSEPIVSISAQNSLFWAVGCVILQRIGIVVPVFQVFLLFNISQLLNSALSVVTWD